MRDQDCVGFLKMMLPTLGLRWSGYRKVHRTLCKRLRRRLVELGMGDLGDYRAHLAADPHERDRLAALCRIPISRFFRDHAVFERLGTQVLGTLAQACARRGAAARLELRLRLRRGALQFADPVDQDAGFLAGGRARHPRDRRGCPHAGARRAGLLPARLAEGDAGTVA
jgi:hypothetical protein